MNPLVSGAATTQAPAVPGAAATTGACTPSAARASERRVAPAAVAAHSVTEYPWPTRPVTPAARRAGSPATGSKRRTVSAAVAGPSGTGGSAVTPAALSPQQALEGHVQAREALLLFLGPPGGRQRLGQRGLLVEQLDAAVADPARLDQHHLRAGRQQVGQHPRLAVEEGEPRLHAVELLALGQALPHGRPPGPARREHRRRGA